MDIRFDLFGVPSVHLGSENVIHQGRFMIMALPQILFSKAHFIKILLSFEKNPTGFPTKKGSQRLGQPVNAFHSELYSRVATNLLSTAYLCILTRRL